jgi:alkylhydroperoxidase family enzyme
MPRLDYADPSLSEESRAQFARLPINLTRMLLHAPAETESFLDLVSGFRSGALDPRLRETVILRVATDEENLYQRMQHLPAAELAGLSGEEVDTITRGDLARLEPRLAVAVRFVDECVTRVKVSDATFADAKAVFSAQEIVEMTLLTGFYMMIARFLATLAIDLDAAPVDWRQSDFKSALLQSSDRKPPRFPQGIRQLSPMAASAVKNHRTAALHGGLDHAIE